MRRRDCLRVLAALGLAVLAAPSSAAGGQRLWAAWDDADGRHQVGLLAVEGLAPVPLAVQEIPTRAHALVDAGDGSVYVVARRPGEWLLHWAPGSGCSNWFWQDGDRRFTGHALLAGGRLLTVESEQEDGRGLILLRQPDSLQELAVWSTHGQDPHELLLDGDSLLVANGGVPTAPETGRLKLDLARMDSSLLRLDLSTGRRLGQWRLGDARLSIRHLARHQSGMVGIALQAEHEAVGQRQAAPTFALFDGQTLELPSGQSPLAGYGGSIAALAGPDAAFALGCPRSGLVLLLDLQGRECGRLSLPEACALAWGAGGRLLAGGREMAWLGAGPGGEGRKVQAPGLRFDNHWAPATG